MNLPQTAKNEVIAWKRDKGGAVHLLLPELNPVTGKCLNCRGDGRLRLGFIVGGPYPEPHSGVIKDGNGDVRDVHFAVSIDGQWYKRRISTFVCPDCNGSGQAQTKAPRQMVGIQNGRPVREIER